MKKIVLISIITLFISACTSKIENNSKNQASDAPSVRINRNIDKKLEKTQKEPMSDSNYSLPSDYVDTIKQTPKPQYDGCKTNDEHSISFKERELQKKEQAKKEIIKKRFHDADMIDKGKPLNDENRYVPSKSNQFPWEN